MHLLLKITTFLLLVGCFNLTSQAQQHDELGYEPGHVYGVWTNINQILLGIAKQTVDDPVLLQSFEQWQLREATGKRPRDVYAQAERFQAVVDRILPKADERMVMLIDELVFRQRSDSQRIYPTQVYLYSSKLLFKSVRLSLILRGHNVPTGPYFELEVFKDKTPDDVYSLVELATYRIKALADIHQSKSEEGAQ